MDGRNLSAPASAEQQPRGRVIPVSTILDSTAINMQAPDFADKVRWRMLHDRNPLFPLLQDKVAVKRYAEVRGVASPRLLHLTTDPADLPFDRLPASYFIKANHGSAWNFLCEQGELYFFQSGKDLLDANGCLVDQATRAPFRISRKHVVGMCRQMLTMRFSQQEWAYHQIQAKILVEEKLESADGGELLDYRFYTFDGEVKAVGVGSATYRKNGQNVFLSPDWETIPLTAYTESLPEPLPARPERLDEMLAAAQRLGAGIDFVRIDLYQSSAGVMLGEMTLYPDAGEAGKPTACLRFNHWLANSWHHPEHPAEPWK